jgi:hypothetical protein
MLQRRQLQIDVNNGVQEMRTITMSEINEVSGGAPSAGKWALYIELAEAAYDGIKSFGQGVVDGWNAE